MRLETRDATAINPRWLIATLKGRGVPVPTIEDARKAVDAMPSSATLAMRERLQRVGGGTDAEDDLAWLATWSAQAKQQTDTSTPVAPKSNETRPGGNTIAGPKVRQPTPAKEHPASHHVYSSKAALCVEATTAGASEHPNDEATGKPFHTLQLELAPAIPGKRYDWGRKIIVQLTKRELHLFIGTLFGWIKCLEFAFHGPANDKTLRFEDQDGHLYVNVKQGKRAIAVPVGAEEMFAITAMAVAALGKNAPELDSQTLLQICKRAAHLYNQSVGVASSP